MIDAYYDDGYKVWKLKINKNTSLFDTIYKNIMFLFSVKAVVHI